MATKIIVFRPNYEIATKYGHYWFNENVKKPALDAGFEVIDLEGDNANRRNVVDNLPNPQVVYFAGVGHGRRDMFTGQNHEMIFDYDDNTTCNIVKNKVIHLLSCETGRLLLPWMADNCGAKACFGYKEVWGFKISEFPNDLAKPFFDSDTTFDRCLFEGATVKEAFERTKQRYDYWLENAPESCRPLLLHDRDAMVVFGDLNARIVQPPPPPPPPPPPEPWWKRLISAIKELIKKILEIIRRILCES